jgi:hypothetical protein
LNFTPLSVSNHHIGRHEDRRRKKIDLRFFRKECAMLKNRNSFLVATLAGSALLFFAVPGLAQNYNYYQSPSFLQSTVTLPISNANQAIANNARDNLKKLGASGSSSAKKTAPAAERQTTSAPSGRAASPEDIRRRASPTNNPLPYTRDRALSAKIREDFLQDYAKQMPSDVASMRESTAQTDHVQIIAGVVQLQGVDSGSMEGLLALWYGQAWAIAHQKPLPTPQQYQGIANQLRTTMAHSSDWKNMTNVQRQTLFERLVYPLFVQKANYQAYLKQGKTDAMARMASATSEGLKKTGLDLQSLRLTDNGFAGL